jgi:biotin transport system substrate-specific component
MKQKLTVQEMTTMALLAALLCVSSYISIRLPFSAVPITAQSLVINLIALLMKPKKAGLTVGIWILLGLVGLPVFSGGNSGFGVLAGATGGYVIGYLAAAILISLVRGKKNHYVRNMVSVIAIGIPVIYAVGVPWMKLVLGLDWKTAVLTGLVPFLVGDLIKAVASVSIAKPLYRIVNESKYQKGETQYGYQKTGR